MQKRMRVMVIGLAVVFGGLVAFNFIKNMIIAHYLAHYEPPAVSVASVKARSVSWHPQITAVGNFEALHGVEVSAQTEGPVVGIFFQSGEYVKKDAPLVQIDDAVNQAELKFNISDLKLQELHYQRVANLLQKKVAAAEDVDTSLAKLQQAQANVEKSQAQIRYKHVTAPFAGKLGIRKINIGQYIIPGQTPIVSLQSLDPLYVNFYLPEQMLPKVYVGQPLVFSMQQEPNILFTGKINAINARIDLNTHNLLVQASLANCSQKTLKDLKHPVGIKVTPNPADGRLIIQCDSAWNEANNVQDFAFLPGMFASLKIEQPEEKNVVVLPTTAISYSLYGNAVFVIYGAPNYRVKRVFVKTGMQQGNYVAITSGIKAGDLVVATGEFKLFDNSRVTLNNSVQLKDVPVETLGP